jgi:hypothetical protein
MIHADDRSLSELEVNRLLVPNGNQWQRAEKGLDGRHSLVDLTPSGRCEASMAE